MATFCLEMANFPNNPNNWTQNEAFEVFEYTIDCLTFFQDARDILNVVLERLLRDNIENLFVKTKPSQNKKAPFHCASIF